MRALRSFSRLLKPVSLPINLGHFVQASWPTEDAQSCCRKNCLKLINRMIDSCWSTTFASLVQKWDSSTDQAPFEPWQLPDLRRGSLFLHHILAKGTHSSNYVLQRPPCLNCTIFAATDIFKSQNSVFRVSKLSWLQLRFSPSPFSRIGRVNRKSPPCSAVWEPTITILFDQTSWEKLRLTRVMMIFHVARCDKIPTER